MYLNGKHPITRPAVEGKFFALNGKRFYIKGVTYGTFRFNDEGHQFPSNIQVDVDFRMMQKTGINTVRTYTVPSLNMLDLAQQHGLKVMVGLPWEQHLTFLDSKKRRNQIIQGIKQKVKLCNKHKAILCYSIGNEIPSQIVRWYGDKKISQFLKSLYQTIKTEDPDGLVTYVNYPSTEYLQLPFLDFESFNVYLESEDKLVKYLARLHNLAGDKPLVLAEIGLDSVRNGMDKQAEVLDWQIRTVFEKGCAGAFVFSWTDEWWRGGAEIEDWDFGLVDRDRNPKPALNTIKKVFSDVPFGIQSTMPKISVVVCVYNGSRTIRDTMEGLKKLDYPEYEVLVINDGSTDNTAQIVSEYDVRLISTENRGLSNARNTGMHEASGEIIAYIDDDAYPDPQWLKYLAAAYLSSDHAGIGGPNIYPENNGFIADCVSNSPGGPLHVLSTDEIAEHIPGVNMTFRKKILMEIGGFDPIFTTAGDDVDICWRIQQKGYTIGFHPSAFVWHYCRNSLKMYWKQQQGYGKAEALLENKWPEKYNVFGHLKWAGRIYGNGLTKPLKKIRKKIFYGSQGSALFQSVYMPATGFFSALPLMPEWYFLIIYMGILSMLGLEWKPLLWVIPIMVFCVSIVFIQAGISAADYKLKNKPDSLFLRFKYWLVITFMHVIQPIARLKGRVRYGLTPWRGILNQLKNIKYIFFSRTLLHWSEEWRSPHIWLEDVEKGLKAQKNKVIKGGEFDRWDFKNRTGWFALVRNLLTIEEHGQGKQYLKLRSKLSLSVIGILFFILLVVLCLLALYNNAFISFVVLGILAIWLLLKIASDAIGPLSSVFFAIDELPDGVKQSVGRSERNTRNKDLEC